MKSAQVVETLVIKTTVYHLPEGHSRWTTCTNTHSNHYIINRLFKVRLLP